LLYRIGDDHPGSDDDIGLAGNRIGYQFAQALPTAGGVTVLDDDIATFRLAQLAQALLEARQRRRSIAAFGA